jgi:hypothetical protein
VTEQQLLMKREFVHTAGSVRVCAVARHTERDREIEIVRKKQNK